MPVRIQDTTSSVCPVRRISKLDVTRAATTAAYGSRLPRGRFPSSSGTSSSAAGARCNEAARIRLNPANQPRSMTLPEL